MQVTPEQLPFTICYLRLKEGETGDAARGGGAKSETANRKSPIH
jgi:hypothetical protein